MKVAGQYPYLLATKVSKPVFDAITLHADANRETTSAALRRVLESWAVFHTNSKVNEGYQKAAENKPQDKAVTNDIQRDEQ